MLYAYVPSGKEKVRLIFNEKWGLVPREFTVNRSLKDRTLMHFRSHVFLRDLLD